MIAASGMVFDRLKQICGSSIVKKENPLAQAPERSGTKLVSAGASLGYVVGEARSHMVKQKIGKQVCLDIAERSHAGLAGGE